MKPREVREMWPPLLVEVFDEGRWHDGQLEAWRHTTLGPRGCARLPTTTGFGFGPVAWIARDPVRT